METFQGAWSAIHSTSASAAGPSHLWAALEEAVRGGRDTDTVAAIAGGLPGAAYGYSAVPFEWRRHLHGWPGLRARDLMMLGIELARGEGRRLDAWPLAAAHDYSRWGRTDALVRHPHDDGVWLGGVPSVARVAELGIDAVVSLCRLGIEDVPSIPVHDHAMFWVVDSFDAGDNAHPEFVLREAAAAVERYRAEGRTVLLHCVLGGVADANRGGALRGGSGWCLPAASTGGRSARAVRARPNPLFLELLSGADYRGHGQAAE